LDTVKITQPVQWAVLATAGLFVLLNGGLSGVSQRHIEAKW